MTAQSRTTLKGYFTRGNKPTQSQYGDLIDSFTLVSTSADYVARSGDTMTGLLVLSGDPVVSAGAATKQYVDAIVSGYALLNSPTFTGSPSFPTSAFGVTQVSADNSKKLATTAFVKSAISSVPQAANQSEMEDGTDTTHFVSPSNIKYAPRVAKAGGSITFSAGTPSLSAGSFGVLSITDSGTGVTTINLLDSMSSANYQVVATFAAVGLLIYISSKGTASFIVNTFTESAGSYPAADINFDFIVFGDL
jgi:hypothetical protein